MPNQGRGAYDDYQADGDYVIRDKAGNIIAEYDGQNRKLIIPASSELEIAGTLDIQNGATVASGGLTVTAGGVTVTAGGLLVTAGRIREVMTPADVDAQNHTLTAAQIFGGILVHTSVTGGGTVTTDTAVAIVAAGLTANGQCIACYYINDGDQTLTLAGGTDVTISDTGQTIAANEAAILLFRRVTATTVVCYVLGA